MTDLSLVISTHRIDWYSCVLQMRGATLVLEIMIIPVGCRLV